MFSKSSKSRNSASHPSVAKSATGGANVPFSIIGGDVTITGNIDASADLHIDGTVEGDIACAALVQGSNSRIIGHVTARSARLAGLVEGSISAEDVVVEATARITGDVHYDALTILTGGRVEGRFAPRTAAPGDLKLISNS